MGDRINFLAFSDQELVVKIKENQDFLGVVYKRCKSNCVNFMRKKFNGSIRDSEFEDVFQDAILVLYEKIVKGDFVLTVPFQTYLNSVCRFQLLNILAKGKKTTEYQENSDDDDDENPMGYRSAITDSLDDIDNSKEPQFLAIEKALEKMKTAGSHCYELLTSFWYHKRSMNEIAETMNYTNGANAKNQKSRCQEKLRVMAFNELNN